MAKSREKWVKVVNSGEKEKSGKKWGKVSKSG